MGCNANKKNTLVVPKNIPNESIFIGEGGGFTGAFSGFEVFRSGKVIKWERNEKNQMDSIKGSNKDYFITEEYFLRLDQLGFSQMEFIDPGNYYYTLELRNSDSTHSITWGGNNSKPPQVVITFYNDLKKFCLAPSKK